MGAASCCEVTGVLAEGYGLGGVVPCWRADHSLDWGSMRETGLVPWDCPSVPNSVAMSCWDFFTLWSVIRSLVFLPHLIPEPVRVPRV